MSTFSRHSRYFLFSFLRHDLKASITVFFVALPLCLGISLASGTPLYSGLLAGVIGGLVISLLSGSQLSVSGPAAGLTAICAAAIHDLGAIENLFLAVAIGGILQILLGAFRLGSFTHFIPSTVIKGMLAGIGILLISKQIPLLIGYNKADFWTKELFNVITLDHAFSHIANIYHSASVGVVLVTLSAVLIMWLWDRFISKKIAILPASFIVVLWGISASLLLKNFFPELALTEGQFVNIPNNLLSQIKLPDYAQVLERYDIIKTGVVICIVASLETLLSIEAIDKLDPYNRITPRNRELVAQGIANTASGVLGGLPITAVIVRSSANAEAGARTRLSGFFHGVWLLLAILLAVSMINLIPFCVLAVLLVKTGYNLAKPKMIRSVYKLGREQFLPFVITAGAVLFTDLLIGVCIGIVYSAYFILKNTYKAGYTLDIAHEGHHQHYYFRLAINVSFINKKRIKEQLEKIPEYSVVEIDGSRSVYIDYDVVETINEFKSKAKHKHIELDLKGIPEVETIEAH